VNNRSECDTNSGYYKHGYCYHDCPDTKYLLNNHCYNSRYAQYTQSDCQAVGGVYDHSYCYMDKCNYSSVNNHCYRNKTTSYSNGTCHNIGGYYATETMPPYCYFNSFNCRTRKVNGQCYSRSSNHSQTVCKTIPDSYFDVSNNTCYYYCTEMPKLGQCFVANNSLFTRDTCANIGGIYSDRTCYYITPYCPLQNTSDGQCYSKRAADLTCDTCKNIGGHYENDRCYYNQNNCSGFRIDGQCYSRRSRYSNYSCNNEDGLYRGGFCYYEASKCRRAYYKNCKCFEYSTDETADTCANISGYYDTRTQRCFYNLTSCPYYVKNNQCYKFRNANLSRTTCRLFNGYFTYESYRQSVCYYNLINCSNWFNDQCYAYFSQTYNEGTCASIRGHYSEKDQGCYYNYFSCPLYSRGGQCYDKFYSGWSKRKCDEANGYYYRSYGRCYLNNYYCRYFHYTLRKCYFYASRSHDCSTCQLLDGFMYSGRCYYKTENCTKPLFLGSNGQCYENKTSVTTAAVCTSISGETFYNESENVCYFSSRSCPSGYFYANCQCYIHMSPIYNAGSCKNFGGYYKNDICYYNSSHCPTYYHSINAQCYRYSRYLTQSTCINIGGHYASTTSNISGLCYYNSFNCSVGFTVDSRYCFMNRSANFSRATCRNIGGIYGFYVGDRQYRSASYGYPWRTYYCLYNTFSCTGYVASLKAFYSL